MLDNKLEAKEIIDDLEYDLARMTNKRNISLCFNITFLVIIITLSVFYILEHIQTSTLTEERDSL